MDLADLEPSRVPQWPPVHGAGVRAFVYKTDEVIS